MIAKNLFTLTLLLISYSIQAMDPNNISSNKDLERAIKSYNISKVREILSKVPKFTQQECDHYHYLLSSEGSIFGIHPSGGMAERLAVPTLIGTPSLAILAVIFGIAHGSVKKIIKNFKQPTSDSPPSYIFKYHGLKSLYYSLLFLTGASAIGSVGLAAAFSFHSYYPEKERKILKLLGKHKQ